ncbi:MAG: bifunctional demethylmenaquinone methyltransferase/2-methoxy-6-polyprenyl-1,4-benzoquinol methylase UbiE [Bacteroidetes bacterium]|nr:bifunctional demethylmenaquinone methyltransferase/2-methoxy-6-polyprenyl-1,4-benzoquinol methylase UbiE [Bacteroidota bacterium]
MNKAKVYSPNDVDVQKMFNDIAPHYDFLNHFLSVGIDKRWRKKTIKLLAPYHPKQILDIATGTGDLAVSAIALKPEKITGVDISEEMLKIAKEKIIKKNLQNTIQFRQAASENLPFDNSSFDAVTVAFGVRNFKNLEKGLEEIYRVIKKDGVAVILEFSVPVSFPMKQLYLFYFRNILPLIGRIVSKSKAAYTYLPETVMKIPQGKAFTTLLENKGFVKTKFVRLSGGICTIYIAEK